MSHDYIFYCLPVPSPPSNCFNNLYNAVASLILLYSKQNAWISRDSSYNTTMDSTFISNGEIRLING